MVGSGIKKLAAEKGLTVKNGVAFGNYGGYMLTLSEGSGWKSLTFAVRFPTEEGAQRISALLADRANQKQYRIQNASVSTDLVQVILTDNPGTMKKLRALLEVLVEEFAACQALGVTVCSSCGQPFGAEPPVTVLLDGVACCLHESCMRRINEAEEQAREERRQEGSVAFGLIGALLGGLVGSIPWAIAYYFGWFVGWLGFLIGAAAQKGYELLHGKDSKAKGLVVILVTVFFVFFAEFFTSILAIWLEFQNDPQLAPLGVSFGEVAVFFFQTLAEDAEVCRAVVADLVLGLLFAALGIFSTVKGIFSRHGKNSGKAVCMD